MPQAYRTRRTRNSCATNPLLGVPPSLQCTFLLWLPLSHFSPILSGTWLIKGLLSFQWLVLEVPHPALCVCFEVLAACKGCDFLPASAQRQKWCIYIWHYFLFHWSIYLFVKWWPVLYLIISSTLLLFTLLLWCISLTWQSFQGPPVLFHLHKP
jgi:hypothetical protein